MRVIDTNVLVYHLSGENGSLSTRSSALMHRLRAGQEEVFLPVTVVFECVYIFQSTYKVPKDHLASLLIEVLKFPGIVTDRLDAMVDALHFWGNQGPLDFADCYHLALTKSLGLDAIYTFDRKMDRYPGVARIEP
jgi:predicted nucleic acid-binding protein